MDYPFKCISPLPNRLQGRNQIAQYVYCLSDAYYRRSWLKRSSIVLWCILMIEAPEIHIIPLDYLIAIQCVTTNPHA